MYLMKGCESRSEASGNETHTNRFCVVQENIKHLVVMHRPRKLGLYSQDLGLSIFLYNTKPVSMRIVSSVAPQYNCVTSLLLT